MCVGFTHGYRDFSAANLEDALTAMVPGSAVSFNRIGYYHFAIFLGWAWPKGGNSDPIPLLCHLSGSRDTKPKASIRLDNFRDIVQNSQIRVYQCTCSPAKRSEVILQCLWRVGKAGYNVLTNNCEHFVRSVIDSKEVSYQAVFAFAAPFIQLPRLIAGSAIGGAVSASASLGLHSTSLQNSSFGMISPDLDLYEIVLDNHGLNLRHTRKNSCCTREFANSDGSCFPVQKLFGCRSCGLESVCKSCLLLCHNDCKTSGGVSSQASCGCNRHGPSASQARSDGSIMRRTHRPSVKRAELCLLPDVQFPDDL